MSEVMKMNQVENEKKNFKVVWAINQVTPEKSYWERVGTAFVCRDNSLNVYLEQIPRDFKLQIRDYVPAAQRKKIWEEKQTAVRQPA